jgi:hypothetical protein
MIKYVGQRRLRFKSVVGEIIPGKKIVWQMKKGIMLPAWLRIEVEDLTDGAIDVRHSLPSRRRGRT